MHFGEPFVSEKAEFSESAQILICLHSVNLYFIYRGKLRFLEMGAQYISAKLMGGR